MLLSKMDYGLFGFQSSGKAYEKSKYPSGLVPVQSGPLVEKIFQLNQISLYY